MLKFPDEDETRKFYPINPHTTYLWPSQDALTVYLLRVEGPNGAFYQADVETGECRNLFDLETEGIHSANVDGNQLRIMKMIESDTGKSVVIDTWAIEQQARMSQSVICEIPPVEAPKRSAIDDIVWCSGNRIHSIPTHLQRPKAIPAASDT